MPEYRYHRMTDNDSGWKYPHTGRLGTGKGYVSEEGFGHEDWNFARQVWDDGRYHLYLRMQPKKEDMSKTFNIVLGVHTTLGALVAGFAENAGYNVANLPDIVWQRRADEIKALEKSGQLGPRYAGKSVAQITKEFKGEREIYNVSVATFDLHILEQPLLIPTSVYSVTTPLYRLLPMTAVEYAALKEVAAVADRKGAADLDSDTSFPEGKHVERMHRARERNRQLVTLAKKEFVKRHGALSCEACNMEPSARFKEASLAGKLIEAHHNVSISDPSHPGKTRIEDLSMLCPSCHRAIHTIRPWLTVKLLRERLGHKGDQRLK